MPSKLTTIDGKPALILDLEEPVAARKSNPVLCEQLEQLTNARVKVETK